MRSLYKSIALRDEITTNAREGAATTKSLYELREGVSSAVEDNINRLILKSELNDRANEGNLVKVNKQLSVTKSQAQEFINTLEDGYEAALKFYAEKAPVVCEVNFGEKLCGDFSNSNFTWLDEMSTSQFEIFESEVLI